MPTNVLILGAGVTGMTIAHVISNDPTLRITIAARDLPGDPESQAWASPWAGANWSPMPESNNERIHKWESHTFNKLWDLIPTGLTTELPSRVYFADDEIDVAIQVWWKDIVRNFRPLPSEDVPSKYKSGVAFSTVSLVPKLYLPWLKQELEAGGVQFLRKYVASVDEAAAFCGPNGVIINATGLGARSLLGAEDLDVIPIKGQGILVDCPGLKNFYGVEDKSIPDDHDTYVISRPDGTSLLGGVFFDGVWDTSVDYALAEDMFSRCAEIAPALKSPATKILGYRVGLRPGRVGGPRVEAEVINLPSKGQILSSASPVKRKQLVIHAYGLGPGGYQRSWGMAEDVRQILNDTLLNSVTLQATARL